MLVNIILLIIFLVVPNNAFAYIDPGTGGILLQALLAGFAAVVTFITMSWRRLKNFVNKIFKTKKKN